MDDVKVILEGRCRDLAEVFDEYFLKGADGTCGSTCGYVNGNELTYA
jgi:hypothetical protein